MKNIQQACGFMMDKTSPVKRRQILRTLGGGLLVGAGLSGTKTVGAKMDGELPNERVEYTTVIPFGHQDVPVGDWILHTIGWYPGPDCGTDEEHKQTLNNFLEKSDTRAWINDTEIDNAHQYWSPPRKPHHFEVPGGWIVEWEYFTPPKAKRTEHEFKFEFIFDEEFWAGWWPAEERDDRERCDRRYHGPDTAGGDGGPTVGSYEIV